MHVFIGWDSREQEAYDVCAHSILRNASGPVKIYPIRHRNLRKAGDFWREWRMDGRGQWWDIEDGKPFSTEFAFTRFLTVHLARQMGLSKAYFCDCDFLFLDDVAKLDKSIDPDFAVSCVWHPYEKHFSEKMDGQIQSPYQRKNWSSLMAFKVNHPANSRLTPECVSMADGSWLHQFGWLHDSLIGEIDPRWNVLVNNNSPLPENPGALHYTLGGPWFEEWTPQPNDEPWVEERNRSLIPTPTTRLKMQDAR